MSRFQVTAILLCTMINMMDGFDVLVIAFTAPSIAADWGLSATVVGLLLSSGFHLGTKRTCATKSGLNPWRTATLVVVHLSRKTIGIINPCFS